MDIIEFFENSIKEEQSKTIVKTKEPFVRKSVIQHAISVKQQPDSSGQVFCNKENHGEISDQKDNISLENEKKIMNCEQISMQRRKLLLNLLTCSRCHHVFQNADEKQEHIQCQGETLLHNCIFKCRKICTSFSLLCQHVCQEHRLNVKNMVKKLTRDPAKKSEPIHCRICQASIGSALALQTHFKYEHPDELPYICNICGHKTHEEVRFKRHMVCHMPETPREYCNICFKEFRNKVSLRTHRNMVHKLGRKYTCAFCGKVLYSSQYLKKHEATHTGEKFKGVVCKFCGKTVEYTKLKNHELTHTGEKPFKCSDCDYRCIQRSNLRIHLKGIHKKDLPRL
jgi:transcription elongation factor Elf1